MRNSPAASLLVAALVMLRHPCTRNKATAQLLLERAAEQNELTPAEREACLDLADELDGEHQAPYATRVSQAISQPASVLPFSHVMKGVVA